MKAVIDTNVFVSALRGGREAASRHLFKLIFAGKIIPMMALPLLFEHLDVMDRTELWAENEFAVNEREEFLEAYLSYCKLHRIHFRWRPNLRDEGDNHLIELAVASQASAIITYNQKDFQNADLKFGSLQILRPADAIHLIRTGA